MPSPNPDGPLADFVVDITHDLRTPLTSIRGFADVLIRGDEQIGGEARLDYLKRISLAAARLDELITQLTTTATARQAGDA